MMGVHRKNSTRSPPTVNGRMKQCNWAKGDLGAAGSLGLERLCGLCMPAPAVALPALELALVFQPTSGCATTVAEGWLCKG
ncbi:hypothetical protein ABBQ38_012981 [Trebouxia sp. C0009 RCD-2024]